MGGIGGQRPLQRVGHPGTDLAAALSRRATHASNQTARQLHGKHRLFLRDAHGRRVRLREPDISMRLALRDPVRPREPPCRLRWRQCLLQESQGLVHAPGVLGSGGSVQTDSRVIPFVS
jgi:hypothetical protein